MADAAEGFAASVVKLRAVAADRTVTYGSAVVIRENMLATTCHVTRDATTIEVSRGDEHWVAESQIGSTSHDICVLVVRGIFLPAVPVRRSAELHLGERVVAAGFQGGGDELMSGQGTIEGLYDYDGGRVIRTSAPFDFGSSGGGLFDEAGNLIGFLAFKARTGQFLRFALPADWIVPENVVASKFRSIGPTSEPKAFWEQPKSSRPAFLGAAVQGVRQQSPN